MRGAASMPLAVTPLAMLRHHVENVLSALVVRWDAADDRGLRELTRGVTVSSGEAHAVGLRSPWRPGTPGATVSTLTTVGIELEAGRAAYSAYVHVWAAGSPPRCLGIERHTGWLEAGPQAWTWREHRVESATETGATEPAAPGTAALAT